MKRFLEKSLKIYAHEIQSFAWLAVIFFSVFFVTAIFRNYVDTAFLKRYGPDYIPWVPVISAILTIVVLAFADKVAKRSSRLVSHDSRLWGICSRRSTLLVDGQIQNEHRLPSAVSAHRAA